MLVKTKQNPMERELIVPKVKERKKKKEFLPFRGLVSILNLGERKFFLPNKGRLIDKIFEILLSKSQKLGGATAPLAPPLTRALV